MPFHSRKLRVCATVVAIGAALVLGAPAEASLVGSSLTASLESPSDFNPFTSSIGITATANIIVSSGIEIQAGDGSDIGSLMYTSLSSSNQPLPEYIDFFDTGVTLRIAAADLSNDGKTGWGAGAKYVFSGLLDQGGGAILGITSINLSNNITNFSNTPGASGCSSGICFSPSGSSLTVFLDQLLIGTDGNSPPVGLVTINLNIQQVPLPGAMLLLFSGLLGFGLTWRVFSPTRLDLAA